MRFLLIAAGAALSCAAPVSAQMLLNVTVSADAGEGRIARRAGLLCFPNGHINISEYRRMLDIPLDELVRDSLKAAGLDVALRSELLAADQGRDGVLSVTVNGLDGRLCARRWGLGDRTNLTGQLSVVLSIRREGGSAPPTTVDLVGIATSNDSPQSITELSMAALSSAFERLRPR